MGKVLIVCRNIDCMLNKECMCRNNDCIPLLSKHICILKEEQSRDTEEQRQMEILKGEKNQIMENQIMEISKKNKLWRYRKENIRLNNSVYIA